MELDYQIWEDFIEGNSENCLNNYIESYIENLGNCIEKDISVDPSEDKCLYENSLTNKEGDYIEDCAEKDISIDSNEDTISYENSLSESSEEDIVPTTKNKCTASSGRRCQKRCCRPAPTIATKHCDKCDMTITASNWAKHTRSFIHTGAKKSTYKCFKCDFTTEWKSGILSHEKSHITDKNLYYN